MASARHRCIHGSDMHQMSCMTKLKTGVLLRQAKIRLDGNATMSLSRCVLLSGYAAFRAWWACRTLTSHESQKVVTLTIHIGQCMSTWCHIQSWHWSLIHGTWAYMIQIHFKHFQTGSNTTDLMSSTMAFWLRPPESQTGTGRCALHRSLLFDGTVNGLRKTGPKIWGILNLKCFGHVG